MATVTVHSKFPWDGNVVYTINQLTSKTEFSLGIRIPSYAKEFGILLNNSEITEMVDIREGYCYIHRMWHEEDTVHLIFDMSVRRVYTNTSVRDNIGCVALMRGPIVYCFEGIDNGNRIQELRVKREEKIRVGKYKPELLSGIVPLEMKGIRIYVNDDLYFEGDSCKKKKC